MDISSFLEKATPAQRDKALTTILSGALSPVLGALPKRELDLLFIEALVQIEYLDSNPAVYELVQKLRITKARARSLIYDRELRRQSPESLNQMAIEALKKPLLQNQGYAVALDIDNPYLADHIRDRVRSRGFASNGSFSPTLIRLSAVATADLIDSYLTGPERKTVKKALSAELGKSTSARDLMAKAISAGASAVAGKAGEELTNSGFELIGSFFAAHEADIRAAVGKILQRKRGPAE